MNCDTFAKIAPAFLYRLLPDEQAKEAQAHLDTCQACAQQLAPLRIMLCREIVATLADYLEGSLSPVDRANFETHLGLCVQCVDYLASYQATIQMSRQAFDAHQDAPPQIPDDLIRMVMDARRKPRP